jgi:hypothetical protein
MLRRVAEWAFAVQIGTKRICYLCVSHQQFTEGKKQNVGTLLTPDEVLSASMRRPVDVKAHFRFLLSMSLPDVTGVFCTSDKRFSGQLFQSVRN